jgi:hypothetical protein
LLDISDAGPADHEKRLTRLETIIEITRPDDAVLRIAQGPAEGADETEGTLGKMTGSP